MPDTYHVSSENTLGLRTNVGNIKWSWGVGMPESPRKAYDACAVRLTLDVDDERSAAGPLTADHGKYHYFSASEGEDSLSYQRTFFGNRKLEFRVSGLLGDDPIFTVNRDYMRFVTHRFMNLHSVGYILTDMAALKLLQAGFAPVHCSAFSVGDSTILVLAPPNTGKTLTTMMACLESDASFLAEDLAITDGKNLYSVPWTSTFRYYERVDTSRYSRLLNKATAMLPALELLSLGKTRGVDTLLQPDQIVSNREVTHLVILERGRESVTVPSLEEAGRKAINLNRYEFNYVKAPTLVAYEFFNPGLDLDNAAMEERRILREVVSSVSECLIVRTDDATRYASLILDHLSHER